MDKENLFRKIELLLKKNDFEIINKTEINYGLQFIVPFENTKSVIRIFEGKKGVKLDLSQIKDSAFLSILEKILTTIDINYDIKTQEKTTNLKEPLELIGIDESGKGDYFGPLVSSACYTDRKTALSWQKKGIIDSKRLNSDQINELAQEISQNSFFNIISISPKYYNQIYPKYNNINHLLADLHLKNLEQILTKIKKAEYVLIDQFAEKKLLISKLECKNININLLQRPKAENHPIVAAASILARHTFLTKFKELQDKYQYNFHLGANQIVKDQRQEFLKKYGKEKLAEVCKMHFK